MNSDNVPAISRRDAVCACLAATGLAPSKHARAAGAGFGQPLGFQAHGARIPLMRDFNGTLRSAALLGYRAVELCSFPGWAGDKLTGDFGPLADLTSASIRKSAAEAGLTVPSCHFKPAELADDRISRTLDWAHGVGVRWVVATDVGFRPADLDEWKRAFEQLNRWGERIERNGLEFGLHAGADLWRKTGDRMVFDYLLDEVPGANCRYEMELSLAYANQIAAGDYVANHPSRFFALHLRDAMTPSPAPPGTPPDPMGGYLYALPLGRGEVNVVEALRGAQKGSVQLYVVEMEVRPPADPMEALRISMEYMRELRL